MMPIHSNLERKLAMFLVEVVRPMYIDTFSCTPDITEFQLTPGVEQQYIQVREPR